MSGLRLTQANRQSLFLAFGLAAFRHEVNKEFTYLRETLQDSFLLWALGWFIDGWFADYWFIYGWL